MSKLSVYSLLLWFFFALLLGLKIWPWHPWTHLVFSCFLSSKINTSPNSATNSLGAKEGKILDASKEADVQISFLLPVSLSMTS